MNPLRRGGCKCWLRHDQAPIAGVTVVGSIIADKQEMRTLSRDNVRVCVKENILKHYIDIKCCNPT